MWRGGKEIPKCIGPVGAQRTPDSVQTALPHVWIIEHVGRVRFWLFHQ